jgi:hypothetical protein
VFQGLAAAKSQVIVVVALGIHDPAAVPEGGAPATPVLMGPIRVEYEPAPFHFSIAILAATPARHLVFIERQIHMLSSIAVDIVDHQAAVAAGKETSRKSV